MISHNYKYIVLDKNGKKIGTIEFEKRTSVPGQREITKAVSESFPKGSTTRLIIPIDVCKNQ